MDENAVWHNRDSTASLQKEHTPQSKGGLSQRPGQRSPLKDILNSSPSHTKVTKVTDTTSRHEVVHQLDEEEEWRERTEVVTALDHRHNLDMAKDLLDQALMTATCRAQVRRDPGPAEFREVKSISLVNSDSEYESAEEDEENRTLAPLENTNPISPASITSPTVWATALLHPASAISTPNGCESFENSLLNSFENMKIEEKDEEKFHDASDDFTDQQGIDETATPSSPNMESVQPAVSPNMESVQPAVSPMKESVQPALSTMKESVQPALSPMKERVQPAMSPMKECVQPALSPSKESVQPALSPMKESVQPAVSPSKESVQPTVSPSKESVQPAVSPSKENVQPVVSPSKENVQPAVSPSKESVQPAISPSKESVQPAVSPSKERVQPAVSPSKESVRPAVSPNMESVQPAISPMKESVQPAVSPSKESVQPAVSPSKESVQPAVSPSKESVQPAVSPSKKSVQPAVFPSKESVQPAVSPSKESVQPAVSPSKESVQPAVSPSKESVQPAVSPMKDSVQPAVSPMKESVQPVVSPMKESVQPAVSPMKESVQPAVSPMKESVQPAVSPMKESVQPVVSPMKESVQHAVSPMKENVQPAVSPSKESVQPAVSPSKESVQPAVSPMKESVQPAVSPSRESVLQPAVSSMKESVQPTVSPIKESVQPAVSPSKENVQSAVSPSKEHVLQPAVSPSKECVLQPKVSPSKECILQPAVSPSKECIVQPAVSPNKECVLQPAVSSSKECVQFTVSPSKENVDSLPPRLENAEISSPKASLAKDAEKPMLSLPVQNDPLTLCIDQLDSTAIHRKDSIDPNLSSFKDSTELNIRDKESTSTNLNQEHPQCRTSHLKVNHETCKSPSREKNEYPNPLGEHCSSNIALANDTVIAIPILSRGGTKSFTPSKGKTEPSTSPKQGNIKSINSPKILEWETSGTLTSQASQNPLYTPVNQGSIKQDLPLAPAAPGIQEIGNLEVAAFSVGNNGCMYEVAKEIEESQCSGCVSSPESVSMKKSLSSRQIPHTEKTSGLASPPIIGCSPPKQGYAALLDVLDDASFNPFATRTSVMNSPEKADCLQRVSMVEKRVEGTSQVCEAKLEQHMSPARNHEDKVTDGADGPLSQSGADGVTSQEIHEAKDCLDPLRGTFHDSSSMSHDFKDPIKDMRQSKKQQTMAEETLVRSADDEIPIPCKVYNLDFLDDTSFNPFTTKTCVVNSPERQHNTNTAPTREDKGPGPSENIHQEVSGKDEASEAMKENTTQEESVSQSILKKDDEDEDKEQDSLEDTVLACPPDVSEQSRQADAAPNKQVDIMSFLDDANFDPFKTKSSITNSPVGKTQYIEQEDGQSNGTADVLQKKEVHGSGQQSDLLPGTVVKEEDSANESSPSPLPIDKSRETSSLDMLSFLPKKGGRRSFNTEEEFTSASDFFNNPAELDALETHGVQGDKHNLVRNSLYVKFDPLVSGRQSLAPFLAQQLLRRDQDEEQDQGEDLRRGSGLIYFSPSPKKKQKAEQQHEQEVPVESFFSMMDTTITHDSTTTTVHDGTTLDATAVEAANNTVIHHPGAAVTEKMVTETEMNQKIKNMELMMQDELLRKGRVFEEEKKQWTKKMEEQSIALVALEEENNTLKGTVQQMVGFVSKIKENYDAAEKRHQQRLTQQQQEWEARLANSTKDHCQTQEELKQTEASFFELVRKFERLREVSKSLQQQEQKLLKEVERVTQEKAECVEKYKTALKTLQETHEKAQEEHWMAKESHEQEMKRASVLIKHAELKILSLTDTVTKKDVEMKRLTSLLEDLTGNMGGKS